MNEVRPVGSRRFLRNDPDQAGPDQVGQTGSHLTAISHT